jgi:hypothetical protein
VNLLLARLHGADADASEHGRMQESVAGPFRGLDESVPLAGVETKRRGPELLMKLGGAHDQSRIAPDPNF